MEEDAHHHPEVEELEDAPDEEELQEELGEDARPEEDTGSMGKLGSDVSEAEKEKEGKGTRTASSSTRRKGPTSS